MVKETTMKKLFGIIAMFISLTASASQWECRYGVADRTTALICQNGETSTIITTLGDHRDNPDQQHARELLNMLLKIYLCKRDEVGCTATVKSSDLIIYAADF